MKPNICLFTRFWNILKTIFWNILKCWWNLESEDSDDSFITLKNEMDWNGFSVILIKRTEWLTAVPNQSRKTRTTFMCADIHILWALHGVWYNTRFMTITRCLNCRIRWFHHISVNAACIQWLQQLQWTVSLASAHMDLYQHRPYHQSLQLSREKMLIRRHWCGDCIQNSNYAYVMGKTSCGCQYTRQDQFTW